MGPKKGPTTLADRPCGRFFRIAEAWRLTEAEQMKLLAIANRSTLDRWRIGKAARLGRDRMERISYIFGIYSAINILLPDPARASVWMRAPNTAAPFGGGTALERMCRGEVSDLSVVRH